MNNETSKQEPYIQTAVKVPSALLERMDRLAEHMSQQGMRVTRSEVLRLAAFKGMDILEEANPGLPPPPKNRGKKDRSKK